MLTRDEFFANGYNSFRASEPGQVCGIQKTVYGEKGDKLYFITFYEWDLKNFGLSEAVVENHRFSVEVRLYRSEDVSWDLNYMVSKNTTLKEVEDFYANAYLVLGCCPDVHNN